MFVRDPDHTSDFLSFKGRGTSTILFFEKTVSTRSARSLDRSLSFQKRNLCRKDDEGIPSSSFGHKLKDMTAQHLKREHLHWSS